MITVAVFRGIDLVMPRSNTLIHSNQQYIRVLFLPHPSQHLLLLLLFMMAILSGVRGNLKVVLKLNILKTFTANHSSSFENFLFSSVWAVCFLVCFCFAISRHQFLVICLITIDFLQFYGLLLHLTVLFAV